MDMAGIRRSIATITERQAAKRTGPGCRCVVAACLFICFLSKLFKPAVTNRVMFFGTTQRPHPKFNAIQR